MKTAALPVILDGDPGLDDAVAWLLALASPELEVLGLTAVHGNVALPLTVRNTGTVLALAESNLPYFAGADRPLVRQSISAAGIHGQTGLPAKNLPEPQQEPQQQHAVEFMIQSVRKRSGEVTLIPTGPLTNLALAFRLAPDLPDKIREVVWMGGSTAQGNRTPAAEFNALADPHAARIVFESGVKLRMVGLNVTMQCIATPDRIEALQRLGNRAGAVSAELLSFYAEVYRRNYGLQGGALHDPLAIAAVLRPDLLEWQEMSVDIETQEGLNFGRTVCDLYGKSRPANAKVAVGVSNADFFDLLLARLSHFP